MDRRWMHRDWAGPEPAFGFAGAAPGGAGCGRGRGDHSRSHGPWALMHALDPGDRGPGPHVGAHGAHGRGEHRHGFSRFGRARRGLIKAAVFAALAERPMHGYQVMQRIEELSGGAWRPSPGSVYPTLQELEDRGLVKSQEVEGKRVYALTDEGAAQADKLRDTAGDLPWTAAEGPAGARMKLKQAVGSLAAAARQVGTAGSDEMVDETLAILADARKRVYALLAEAD